MVSLELAKELEEAGLEWKPQSGDFCFYNDEYLSLCYECMVDLYVKEFALWLPRLNQLLDEIEKRGYSWEMGMDVSTNPLMESTFSLGYWCEIFKDGKMMHSVAREGTRTDATGKALLWILERERR